MYLYIYVYIPVVCILIFISTCVGCGTEYPANSTSGFLISSALIAFPSVCVSPGKLAVRLRLLRSPPARGAPSSPGGPPLLLAATGLIGLLRWFSCIDTSTVLLLLLLQHMGSGAAAAELLLMQECVAAGLRRCREPEDMLWMHAAGIAIPSSKALRPSLNPSAAAAAVRTSPAISD